MGKSISNLYRYAEISKACSKRFLDAMVDIVPARSTLEEIGKVCSKKKINGKTVTGFNVWSPEFVLVMETVCDGRFLLSGFRNKEISSAIFPEIADVKKTKFKNKPDIKETPTAWIDKKSAKVTALPCHFKRTQGYGGAY